MMTMATFALFCCLNCNPPKRTRGIVGAVVMCVSSDQQLEVLLGSCFMSGNFFYYSNKVLSTNIKIRPRSRRYVYR